MISGSISFITRPSGGLGIRSAEMLAPSAHMATPASTLSPAVNTPRQHLDAFGCIWMQGDQSAETL